MQVENGEILGVLSNFFIEVEDPLDDEFSKGLLLVVLDGVGGVCGV